MLTIPLTNNFLEVTPAASEARDDVAPPTAASAAVSTVTVLLIPESFLTGCIPNCITAPANPRSNIVLHTTANGAAAPAVKPVRITPPAAKSYD